jgi:hypothetical protein
MYLYILTVCLTCIKLLSQIQARILPDGLCNCAFQMLNCICMYRCSFNLGLQTLHTYRDSCVFVLVLNVFCTVYIILHCDLLIFIRKMYINLASIDACAYTSVLQKVHR